MKLVGCALFSLLSVILIVETVASDTGCCYMDNLAELLTPSECKGLVLALSQTDDDVLRHIQSLSLENNQLDLHHRSKRELASDDEDDDKCRKALEEWLKKNDEEIFLDRLSRSLQHIGRMDVAIEISNNINQDESEKLMQYVEGYHTYIGSLTLPGLKGKDRDRRQQGSDF
ncbi:transmembrane and death domain protein 1 [Synchiropus picturatus]